MPESYLLFVFVAKNATNYSIPNITLFRYTQFDPNLKLIEMSLSKDAEINKDGKQPTEQYEKIRIKFWNVWWLSGKREASY
jgi:hypothetical protein